MVQDKQISIVMTYHNRRDLLYETMTSIAKWFLKYNYEIIIVDDASDEKHKIKDFETMFLNTKVIEITKEEKGKRVNPGSAFNKGFAAAQGEIIIIQSAECYHVGDILGHTLKNLQEQDYFSYSCYAANSGEVTSELLNSEDARVLINNKDFKEKNKKIFGLEWYNHPTVTNRSVAYHHCSAIYKSKLDLIGGFDARFADGYCYDDDELLTSIKHNLKLNIKIVDPNKGFVIHQFHKLNVSINIDQKPDTNPIKKKWLKNKKLFEEIESNHKKNNFKYPKLLHLYWDGSPLSFLNYLTVVSFNEYHKNWKIIVYTPSSRVETKSWTTPEHKISYHGKCYFQKLLDIPNVVTQKVCFNEIGFNDDVSEVIKSDYLRYYILNKHGGLWSDFDIVYTASVEEKMNFNEDAVIFKCISCENPIIKEDCNFYYPVGLFLVKPNNKFFKFILEQCAKHYNGEYQSIGARMFDKLFPMEKEVRRYDPHGNFLWEDMVPIPEVVQEQSIFNIDNSIRLCDKDFYLPWAWNELGEFLEKKNNILPSNNVGIHWFNGASDSKQYATDLEKRLDNFKVECYLDKIIDKYIEPSKSVRSDSNYNIGLCFKTYVDKHTSKARYKIISEFIDSLNLLVDNYDNLTIIGVVDCKLTPKLKKCFKKINNKIKIIVLNENKGISFATNIGIEFLLNHNCDYIFCCDDDIVIKDKNVLTVYIDLLVPQDFL